MIKIVLHSVHVRADISGYSLQIGKAEHGVRVCGLDRDSHACGCLHQGQHDALIDWMGALYGKHVALTWWVPFGIRPACCTYLSALAYFIDHESSTWGHRLLLNLTVDWCLIGGLPAARSASGRHLSGVVPDLIRSLVSWCQRSP